jgi:DNA polymerase-3 subunit epsilon
VPALTVDHVTVRDVLASCATRLRAGLLVAPDWQGMPGRLALSWRRDVARPLSSVEFVVVDVETTGWLAEQAAITEIGAVRVAGGDLQAEFSSLVNPGQLIPPEITALTGISDAMVTRAPPIAEVLPAFLAFAAGSVLAAHNAPFDIGFLTTACQRCGLRWPRFRVVDTVALARDVLGEAEVADRKLATLAGHFGTRTHPEHRALADARATAEILQRLLDRLAAEGVRTLGQLAA